MSIAVQCLTFRSLQTPDRLSAELTNSRTRERRIRMRNLVLIASVLTLSMLRLIPDVVTPQTIRATISGTIKDGQGNVVANARVVAKNLDTGVPRETATDGEGRYLLPELPPGRYEISVVREGFRPRIRHDIDLSVCRAA